MQTLTATTAAVSSNGRFVVVADGNGLGEIFDLESSGTVTLAVGDARRVDVKFLFADQAGVLAEHVAPYDYGESDDGLFHNRVVLRDPDTGALLGEWDDPLGSPAQSHGYLTMELVGEDTLLTHRENGSVGIWRIGVEDWLRDLCALGGELTGAERQRYLVGVQIGSVCGA